MTDPLETLLADTLAERADTLVPPGRRLGAFAYDVPPTRDRRSRPALAALAAAVVLVVIGASAVVVRRGAGDPQPPPADVPTVTAPTTPPTATQPSDPADPRNDGGYPTTAAVAASADHFFKLTSQVGCARCASAWRRAPGGEWELLHTFGDEAQNPDIDVDTLFAPLTHLAVSADGTDLWASGQTLWSSHDSGATWAQVTVGPGRRRAMSSAITVTDTVAVGVDYLDGLPTRAWTTPVDTDDWTPLPSDEVPPTSFAPLGDRFVFRDADEGLASPRIVGTVDGTDLESLPLPDGCSGDSNQLETRGEVIVLACPPASGDQPGWQVVWRSVGLGPWQAVGQEVVGAVYPLSATRVLGTGRGGRPGVVLTGTESIPTQVPDFFFLAVIGDEVVLDGGDGRDRVSVDGGVTWETRPR